jgi:hypothetical protein
MIFLFLKKIDKKKKLMSKDYYDGYLGNSKDFKREKKII